MANPNINIIAQKVLMGQELTPKDVSFIIDSLIEQIDKGVWLTSGHTELTDTVNVTSSFDNLTGSFVMLLGQLFQTHTVKVTVAPFAPSRIQLESNNDTFTDISKIIIQNDTGVTLSTTRNIIFSGVPTSSAGLPSGAIWSDAGTLKIVA